jgi:GntR family transcriptional regulator, transcriptional repressor for pyruvate dehydrogenase complex
MTADPVPTDRLRQPRVSDVVAGILRDRIVDGVLADGSRLPKQDELRREFRVSPASLREALRILETEGLLVVQRGNVGGAVVRTPDVRSLAHSLGLVLRARRITTEDLLEAMQNLEPTAAALAAQDERRGTGVVPRLRRAIDEAAANVGDNAEFRRRGRLFHHELVRRCGNSTLAAMSEALDAAWSARRGDRAVRDAQNPASRRDREDVLAAHEAILHAIEAGDPDRAAMLVRRHAVDTAWVAAGEQVDPPRD